MQAWWVNTGNIDVDVLTVRSFQGIVNRSGPNLFVVQWEDDLRWIEIFKERYGDYIQLTEITSQEELFNHPVLRPLCKEIVAYDRKDSELAMNGALTMAGIHGACVADKRDVQTMLGFGFTIVDDRRDYPAWQTNEGVNEWALTVQSQTNQNFYCASEGLLHGSPKSVDTAVCLGMLWFLVDAKAIHLEDQGVQERILARYPPHTIATGWWSGEVHDVRMVSKYGHTFATNSVNCSFFMHGQNFIEIGKQKAPEEPLPEIQPGKTYAFISYTQGDAIYFCSDRNMNQWMAKSNDGSGRLVREKYPFGLMHNSIQTILQPMVPAYFYDTQDPPNQWFSGKAYGYAYPKTLLENGYLAEHLDKGGAAMQKMGIQDMMLNDRAAFLGTSDTGLIEHIAHIIDTKPRSLIIKHPFSAKAEERDQPMLFNGIPAFGDPVMERKFKDKSMDIPATADAIFASMKDRQFFWVFLNNQATARELEQLYEYIAADSRFDNLVLLNPDSFIRLYMTQVEPGLTWRIIDDAWLGEDDLKANHGDDSMLHVRAMNGTNGAAGVLKFEVDTWDAETESIFLRLRVNASEGARLILHRLDCDDWCEETISLENRIKLGHAIADGLISGDENEVLFDVSEEITSPGTYSFAIISDDARQEVTVSSRESMNPPWLVVRTN